MDVLWCMRYSRPGALADAPCLPCISRPGAKLDAPAAKAASVTTRSVISAAAGIRNLVIFDLVGLLDNSPRRSDVPSRKKKAPRMELRGAFIDVIKRGNTFVRN